MGNTPNRLRNEFASRESTKDVLLGYRENVFNIVNGVPRNRTVPVTFGDRMATNSTAVLTAIGNERPGRCGVRVRGVALGGLSNAGGVIVEIASPRLLVAAKKVIRKVDNSPVLRGKGLIKTMARIFISSPAHNCKVFTRGVLRTTNVTTASGTT